MSDAKPPPKEYHTPDGKTALQSKVADRSTSAFRKYTALAVGSDSYWDLIKYEFVTTFITPLPGALGLVLRKLTYRGLLGSVGRNVVIGRSVTLRHPKKISIGDGALIDDYAVLDAKGETNNGIAIGKNVIVGRNTVLSCKDGDLSIGDNTNIAMNCVIQSGKTVQIGRNVLIAAYCYVIGGGTHRADRTDIPVIEQGQIIRGITIGDNAWLGAGATVMDGVDIGRDAILGAGAVATRSIPPFAAAVGIPARVTADRRTQTAAGAPEEEATRNDSRSSRERDMSPRRLSDPS
jgi:acetyltransferase-like isoleucine patch superfamily enzyme